MSGCYSALQVASCVRRTRVFVVPFKCYLVWYFDNPNSTPSLAYSDSLGVDTRQQPLTPYPSKPRIPPPRRLVSRYEQDAAAWEAWVSRYSDRLGREENFDEDRRHAAMVAANPVFILRNWIAQVTKKQALGGGFTELILFFELWHSQHRTKPITERSESS